MRTIAVKLTLAFLLVGLTGAVLMALILQVRARSAFDQFILNRDQQATAEFLMEYYRVNGSWRGLTDQLSSGREGRPNGFGFHPGGRGGAASFTLVGADRTVLVSDSGDQIGQRISEQDLQGAVPLTASGKTIGWMIPAETPHSWVSDSPEGMFLARINQATLVSGLVAVGLALLLGGLLAFTMTRSLREMTDATVEIAGGKFGRQVKVRSRDELGELASSFNKMSLDLAQANDLRRQMTADIAHDLRTPLSVISGYAEALSDGKLPGTPQVYDVLNTETQHLSRLVEDLRLLSLADAGELHLMLQLTEPRALLERAIASHAVAAQAKGVALRLLAAPALPAVSVDPERIAQVLDNLVSNALRYTPAGGEIILSAARDERFVLMRVSDTGSGIAPQDLPHIFDRFYRGDPSRPQNGESGLGLAIARSIVDAHKGVLLAQSEPGKGAAFTIRLPISE